MWQEVHRASYSLGGGTGWVLEVPVLRSPRAVEGVWPAKGLGEVKGVTRAGCWPGWVCKSHRMTVDQRHEMPGWESLLLNGVGEGTAVGWGVGDRGGRQLHICSW